MKENQTYLLAKVLKTLFDYLIHLAFNLFPSQNERKSIETLKKFLFTQLKTLRSRTELQETS